MEKVSSSPSKAPVTPLKPQPRQAPQCPDSIGSLEGAFKEAVAIHASPTTERPSCILKQKLNKRTRDELSDDESSSPSYKRNSKPFKLFERNFSIELPSLPLTPVKKKG